MTSGTASAERITLATKAADIPGGPDAIGGVGDYLLVNKHLRAVVVQPEPVAIVQLTYGLASSGGTLGDLSTTVSDNDQWNQMSQGVVGHATVLSGDADSAYASNPSVPAFFDFSADFITSEISAGDVLVITGGVNAGRSYRIGTVIDSNTLALYIAPGQDYQDEDTPPTPGTNSIAYHIKHNTDPLSNVIEYDSADILDDNGNPTSSNTGVQVVLRLSGGIQHRSGPLPDGTDIDPATKLLTVGGVPLSVETDYILDGDKKYLTVESRVSNYGGAPGSISAVSDIVVTGDTSAPDILAWTFLSGFQANGLDSQVIAPFVGFRGRNTPGASYAIVDSDSGVMYHSSDGKMLAVNIQASNISSIGDGETLIWKRHVIVGQNNDVSSASDTAIALLGGTIERTDPVSGLTVPNGYFGSYTITGTVMGAPSGTTVSVTQVSPALVYDPGPPFGVTNAAGFYPSTILGVSEPFITMTAPDEITGAFSVTVPQGFSGLSGSGASDLYVPEGFENGTYYAIYRVIVERPGQESQSVLISTAQSAYNLQFNVLDGAGTIEILVTDDAGAPIPAKVLVIGKDPDGAGPAPKTPDPVFGGSEISTSEQRATGTGNVLHLLDGTASVNVPPGAYQVIAGRGLEYSAGSFPEQGSSVDFFLVSAGQIVRTETNGTPIRISRVLDSSVLPDPGGGTFVSPLRSYVSADLDVRTGRSEGSSVPLRDVLLSYLASGVEILVSTDNDRLTNMSGTLIALDNETNLDLASMISGQVGVKSVGSVISNTPGVLEFPNSIGQFSAWPLIANTAASRDGAPYVGTSSPAELYEKYRDLGASVIQMNNPRFPVMVSPLPPFGQGFLTNGKAGYPQLNTGISSLSAGGYAIPLRSSSTDGSLDDLNAPRTIGGTRYNDFDVMEIYAGSATLYDINKLDWYAMTSAGYIRTATANSKVSDLTGAIGIPRNYVYVSGDGSADVGLVNMAEFNNTLKPSLVQPLPGTNQPQYSALFPAIERPGAGTNAMEVLGSSGPVVIIEVDADEDGTFEGQVGDIVADDGDSSVDVRVTILAAPWVPVDTGLIYLNGGNVASALTGLAASSLNITGDLEASVTPTPSSLFSSNISDVVRLRKVYTIALPPGGGGDHWITAEARGNVIVGGVYALLAPDIDTAIGFTNPVFINSNADIDFDPNGLP